MKLARADTTSDRVCVVRLITSCYVSSRGELCFQRTIRFMKKLSNTDWFLEDVSYIGPDEVYNAITNINSCLDGLYYVVMCNVKTDWETGYIDSYDYALHPYPPTEDLP